MGKIFIDTSNLPKSFRKLNPSLKLAWFYLWTHCDSAGVWEIDEDLFEFENGFEFEINEIKKHLGEFLIFSENFLLIKDFIKVNYGTLKPNYNPHKPAYRSIAKHNLKLEPSLNQAYFKLVDEDEDVYEEEEEGKDEDEDEDVLKKEKTKKFTKSDFKKIFLDLGADPVHLEDWIKVRVLKKSTFTETALKTIVNQCSKNNYPVSEAIRLCAENSWAGFKYEWIVEKNKSKNKSFEANSDYFNKVANSEVAKNFKFN